MDYKEFRNGIISASSFLAVFSTTLFISSIALKPYIALEPRSRDIIVIMSGINILFCIYWLIEGVHFKKIFKLEEKNIKKFGKRLGIVTLLYIPNLILFSSFFFLGLHNLLFLMFILLLVIKICLLGLIFKEVYDLVLKNPNERKFELEHDRKLYFDK
jgi:hypothetical protein